MHSLNRGPLTRHLHFNRIPRRFLSTGQFEPHWQNWETRRRALGKPGNGDGWVGGLNLRLCEGVKLESVPDCGKGNGCETQPLGTGFQAIR